MTGAPATGIHNKTHLEESQDHLKTPYVCDATVNQNDMVYLDSSGIIMRGDADDINKCHLIGCAIEKPSPVECRINYHGLCFDFSGLVPGQRYWLSDSTPGGIISVPFNDNNFNKVIKFVGIARDSQTLFLDLSQGPIQS